MPSPRFVLGDFLAIIFMATLVSTADERFVFCFTVKHRTDRQFSKNFHFFFLIENIQDDFLAIIFLAMQV